MEDRQKTRAELLAELAELRGRLQQGAVRDWYRQTVEESPNPIFWVDRACVVRGENIAARKMIRGGGSLLGGCCTAFIRADPRMLAEMVARVFARERLTSIELIFDDAEGAARTMQARLYPLYAADASAVVGCVFAATDVTDRVRYEAELLASKEEAEQAVRLKSTILNNLSHEIRTPLTAILGFTELLIEEVEEPHREFIRLIRSGSKRLMETLVAMLDLARLESGDMQLVRRRFDLGAEVREAVALFRVQAEQKGLALTLHGADAPVWVELDPVGLSRILANLLSNAIKFTAEGFVRVEVGTEPGAVYLRVVDSGDGIRADFLPHLFEAFKQESEGFGRLHEGTGLGLAISRRLVEQMGGRITVESEKGRGSTFTVRFPRPSEQL